MYNLTFAPAAFNLFKKNPKPLQEKLLDKARELRINPFLGKRLSGKYKLLNSYRFSLSGHEYRIIYQYNTRSKLIIIRLIDTRENIYKKLDRMKVKDN